MKEKEKNIAIAKACGWVQRQWNDRKGRPCSGWKTPEGIELGGNPPNYFNNLNAMHEAEKVLTDEQKQRLLKLYFHADMLLLFEATAAQRAEAFGLTLKLW
jgi:hypothetical protein